MSHAVEGDSTFHDLEKQAAAAVGRNPAQVRAEKAAAKAAAARKKKKKRRKKRKGRAMGGHVTAGEEYIVGEQGHELFVPGVNGSIMSNASLMSGRAMGGSASGGSSAPISISMDGNSLWQGLVTHSRTSGFTIRQLGV
jgi:septal ring factor EnvC (AmiA/AmiB activator)